ncbi:MAG: hypothetical protein RLZZ558_1477 [Planctomycetota bacterium]|jgi:hypothetical protein
MLAIDVLERLRSGDGADTLAAAMSLHDVTPAAVTRLRRGAPVEVVTAALEVAAARRSLQGRRADWDTFWADRAGAAQASDDASAAWKAARMAEAPAVADLCCGCGADLKALAVTTARGVDMREDRVWMAQANSGRPCTVMDVTAAAIEEPAVHVDPSRRVEASAERRHAWDMLQPGPAFLRSLQGRVTWLAVKLGPGVEIPASERPADSELAFLSRDRRLTQAVLLTGAAAHRPGRNTAVRLRDGAELAGVPSWTASHGDPAWPAVDRWERWIAEPDPALERSGLLPMAAAPLRLRERAPGLGLCTTGDPPAPGTDLGAWFRWFEVLEPAPPRLDHLQRRLRALGAGVVEVKVRGRAVPADEWSRTLRGQGNEPLVVFVHRIGMGSEAIIARRAEAATQRPVA